VSNGLEVKVSHAAGRSSRSLWVLVVALLAATTVGAGLYVRFGAPRPVGQRPPAHPPSNPVAAMERDAGLGARLVISGGGETCETTAPMLAFALNAGESLHPRIPVGAFVARFEAVLVSDVSRRARLGAIFAGCTVRVIVAGRVIASGSAAAGDPREAFSGPLTLAPGTIITYEVEGGENGSIFRALWHPEETGAPHPLPIDGSRFARADRLSDGVALVQAANCTACHVPGSASLASLLGPSAAPRLEDAGARLHPRWMREWIADPHRSKPASRMPRLFRADADTDTDTIEDIMHFLASLGGPLVEESPAARGDRARLGMALYHDVGCTACHGALAPLADLPGNRPDQGAPFRRYEPLGRQREKTTISALARFLQDPLHWRPGGRMPSMRLSISESEAIAEYVMSIDDAPPADAFEVDAARVERGRGAFVDRGCLACHDIPGLSDSRAGPTAPPFEALIGSLDRGCLSADDAAGGIKYAFTDRERRAVRTAIEELVPARSHRVPSLHLHATLKRLNCIACHDLHESGGPEPALAAYFRATSSADMGVEGRLPPTLTDVGAKLTSEWLHALLADGAVSRPYMATRMPQFGESNVHALPRLLASASGVPLDPDSSIQTGQGVDSGAIKTDPAVGRILVGIGGFNCITCHMVAGRASTGTPGVDLATMTRRIRHDYFVRWLLDPAWIRPDTRMSAFFLDGRSGLIAHYDGDARRQIDAIWAYLSQGSSMPMPDGLPHDGGYELAVHDEPIVFRTFLDGGATRAIACGFPEQIHIAFDMQRCRLVFAWEGVFIDAAGAWALRAEDRANPLAPPGWSAPEGPSFVAGVSPPEQWRDSGFEALHFRGYRLDAARRPILFYDLDAGGRMIRIEEQPQPLKRDGASGLRRLFFVQGQPGDVVHFNVGAGANAGAIVDATVEIGGFAGARPDGLILVPLDPNGEARFVMEVMWR
jgi:mono/diheme cytochrome c family protein